MILTSTFLCILFYFFKDLFFILLIFGLDPYSAVFKAYLCLSQRKFLLEKHGKT